MLDYFVGSIYFESFEDLVEWLCSLVPYFIIAIFVVDCFFSILDTLIHMGGRR